MATPHRAITITVVVGLQALVGLLTLFDGLAALIGLMLPETFPQIRPLRFTLFVAGIWFLIFSAIDFVIAYGLFVGKKWAWVLSAIFSVLGTITAVFSLFVRPRMGEFFALVLDLAILFYLMQPRVQAYFKPVTPVNATVSNDDGKQKVDGLKPDTPSDLR
ncbi:MAG TPA: DUF2127 domain-containing protein [Terriglobales bacterium]|nr:DUF2127 domain-containing protein [Terriglobales bacterium]